MLQIFDCCCCCCRSRSIQKLLKHFTTQQQISMFMYALSPGTLALSKDLNGQHVIQHCLMHFSDEDNMVMIRFVCQYFYYAAIWGYWEWLYNHVNFSICFIQLELLYLPTMCLLVFVAFVTILHSPSKQVFKFDGWTYS